MALKFAVAPSPLPLNALLENAPVLSEAHLGGAALFFSPAFLRLFFAFLFVAEKVSSDYQLSPTQV